MKKGVTELLPDLTASVDCVDDRDTAFDILPEREGETAAGVDFGIDIPHAKTDIISKPTAAFVCSAEGIDFDAMGDEPAKLLFMIFVPAAGGEDHLQILSAPSRSLMYKDVREKLLEAENRQIVQDVPTEMIERWSEPSRPSLETGCTLV